MSHRVLAGLEKLRTYRITVNGLTPEAYDSRKQETRLV